MANPQPTDTRKSSTYPPPLIIPPLTTHKQTFIILHGRGSNATTFGPPLLAHHITEKETLRSTFPHAQFIFPTASKRRATIYNRSIITQWFDNWSLQHPNERTELQIQGLRESSTYIHSLLRTAIADVSAQNVVLGGLSQGAAAALVAMLTWEGERLAAGFGLCGWLPFRMQMEDVARSVGGEQVDEGGEGEGEDVFERDGGMGEGDGDGDGPTQAQAFLREELGLASEGRESGMAIQNTPLFLGHGVEDERVPVGLGNDAVRCLEVLGASVEWCEYEGLGHWYSVMMVGDLVGFLRKKTGWGTMIADRGSREE